jgi:hypothetical protein
MPPGRSLEMLVSEARFWRTQKKCFPQREEIVMLKAGDRVYIDGTKEEGTVKDVHPHEIIVRVKTTQGHEDRKYALEDLRLDPTLGEASRFVDH